MKNPLASALFTSVSLLAVGMALPPTVHAATTEVPVIADGITGVVSGSKGPEAGVWVIVETEDTPTRFIKIVVTDDSGRYLVPELPKAKYKVWVRGYGLVDSKPVEANPGTRLNLTAVPAPNAKAAAQYYPASYWYSMIRPPAAGEFPGTGPDGNGIAPLMKTQQQWLAHMSEGCQLCHQLGDKATRELTDNSVEGWAERLRKARSEGDPAVGNLGHSYATDMQNNITRFGAARGLKMFADWTDRIEKGELPAETPPRPTGIERNVVLSVWDWANGNQIHDEISTDRRNPTVNANGLVYGVSPSTGYIQWLDPVKNAAGQIPIPGDGKDHNEYAYPHNPMLDERARVWVTDSSRGRQIASYAAKGVTLTAPLGVRAEYCTNEATNPYAKYYPMPGNNNSMAHVYDPATKKIDSIPTCYGTHHLTFGYDQDNTLFFSGDSNVAGWIKTKVYDQTHDLQKAEGWCPMVLDTKEKAAADGRITPDRTRWNAPGAPIDPTKDTRITGFLYGMDAHTKDGTIWYGKNNPSVPSGIVRLDRGLSPPETCKTEYYEPPQRADGTYAAFDARGIGIDTNGIAWTTFGSGQIGSFDRSKCKVMRGPTATGQHCPEGWTFHDVPGPKIPGAGNVSADWFYLNWVDTYDTLGLGANTPLTVGSNSDSLVAMLPKTNKIVHFTVPYPMGFYSRGLDGRIDDPKTGWKGRGIWASMGTFPVWHQEGGEEGRGPQIVKFQVRPDPLAH